ncbi:hypothetical protein [Lentzea cavernae]|uniref:Uncharacterized protein n=1 Tax=Lentzea cavernae TaxID=2020703 RepID=A0ABQ3MLC7_9PSEU|nr:hypothetical protein [Lentzea cavernae]GHH49364.1 hypothetical protein GCM10017774_56640 [Lentzea cavernae]
MLLWDYEMREVRPLIDALSPRQCFALSVRAIRHVLAFDRGVLGEVNPATADFVRRSLELADEAVAAGRSTIGEPDGYLEEIGELLEDDTTDSAGPLIMALLNLYGEVDTEPVHALETLSSTYEVVLARQRIEVVTPETERQHTALVQVIAEQKELVRSASAT